MIRLVSLLLASAALIAASLPLWAMPALPQTNLRYRIEVELKPDTRALVGAMQIEWANSGDQPVERVPLHLYLNAFAHEGTSWVREVVSRGRKEQLERLLEVHPDPWGHIELESVHQTARLAAGAGSEALLEWQMIQPDDGNPLDRTLALVELDRSVPPGGVLELRVAFRARLPVPIARTGGEGDFFLVAQWFPKLAAFEEKGVRGSSSSGFRPAQFHGPTEFYADFADWDVTLVVPEDFTLGATGRRVEEAVHEGRLRARYVQRAVHDFAFVAGRGLHDETFVLDPQTAGPAVAVRYLLPRETARHLQRWRQAVEGALTVLGRRVGPYPYETLTVVCPPYRHAATSGMEYPTLITGFFDDPIFSGFPLGALRLPEGVLVHEFGHQYFYGLLASNEREDAFLDEGFNTYWESEILTTLYGAGASGGRVLGRPIDARAWRGWSLAVNGERIREPVRKRPSWLFRWGTSRNQIYSRPAMILATAARLFGHETLDAVFRAYYERFVFRHPGPEDFLAVAAEVGGENLGAFLREAFLSPELADYQVRQASSEPWKPPRGRLPEPEGTVSISDENREEFPEFGLDPAAREEDGRVLVELRDPGWIDGATERRGQVVRRLAEPEIAVRSDAKPREGSAGPHEFFESWVLLDGPARRHLPVSVLFRFDDGVLLREHWDGRSAWRAYRFLRPASLLEVRLDPEERIALDVRPENDARLVDPDSRFLDAWGAWLGALAQWLAAGASLWL